MALSNSRFHKYTKLIALTENINLQSKIKAYTKIQDLIHYTNYLQELKENTNEYYRLSVIEKSEEKITQNKETYLNNFTSMNENLMKVMSIFEKNNREYNFKEFRRKLRTHFGTL